MRSSATGRGKLSGSAHDPGPAAAAQRAAAALDTGAIEPAPPKAAPIRVGTAGWTDATLTKKGVFYPEGVNSAEDRLRYYASLFNLVEVDSTYYTLPVRRNAELWVERTPPGFEFDMKAHALMTGQPTEVSRLPHFIRDALPTEIDSERIYSKDLPGELYDAVWTTYLDAIEPLQKSGRLGSILLQYPRWFHPSSENRDAILEARQRLNGVRSAVEFRNAAWFSNGGAEKTLDFLHEHQIPFVMVDAPQGTRSSVPPITAVTSSDLAIVRFHGRRVETWEAPGVGVADRFRYLYDTKELEEWRPRVLEAAAQTAEVHVVMNNCYANYGTTNALEFIKMIRETNKRNEG